MRYQSGIQIVLIIVALIIITVVVRPELDAISQKQNQLAVYNNAIEKADAYNRALQEKINLANALPASDLSQLNRFLPASVDVVAVSRDLTAIVEANEMLLQDVSVGEASTPSSEVGQSPVAFVRGDVGEATEAQSASRGLTVQSFEVEVVGSYQQLKGLLQDIERNAYPLTLTSLEFSSGENGEDALLFSYTLQLETYALPAQ